MARRSAKDPGNTTLHFGTGAPKKLNDGSRQKTQSISGGRGSSNISFGARVTAPERDRLQEIKNELAPDSSISDYLLWISERQLISQRSVTQSDLASLTELVVRKHAETQRSMEELFKRLDVLSTIETQNAKTLSEVISKTIEVKNMLGPLCSVDANKSLHVAELASAVTNLASAIESIPKPSASPTSRFTTRPSEMGSNSIVPNARKL